MLFGAGIVVPSAIKEGRGERYSTRPFSGRAVSIRIGASDPLQLQKFR